MTTKDPKTEPAPQLIIGCHIRWYKSAGKGTGWHFARLVQIEKKKAQIQPPNCNKRWVPLADVEYYQDCAAG